MAQRLGHFEAKAREYRAEAPQRFLYCALSMALAESGMCCMAVAYSVACNDDVSIGVEFDCAEGGCTDHRLMVLTQTYLMVSIAECSAVRPRR